MDEDKVREIAILSLSLFLSVAPSLGLQNALFLRLSSSLILSHSLICDKIA